MRLPDWMLEVPIAHRGLHRPGSACPENSMAALRAAARHGYGAEVDVQLTGDGKVVIFHDFDLKRLTGQRGRMAERPSQSLRRLRIHRGRQTPPLLRDALRALPDLPLLVELKMGNLALAPAVAAVLDAHDGPFAIQSFDPELVAWFADHRPDWPRGLIGYRNLRFSLNAREPRYQPEFLDQSRPHFVAWYVGDLPVTPDVPKDMPVLTWTVRSGANRRRAARFADNIIFENYLA